MNRFLTFALSFVLTAFSANAQSTVSFMGVPVDGTKYDVEQALLQRGFNLTEDGGVEGKVNDEHLFVTTFSNDAGQVYRIAAANMYPIRNQKVAAAKYNELIGAFEDNPNYTAARVRTVDGDANLYKELALKGAVYKSFFYKADSKVGNAQPTQLVGIWLIYCHDERRDKAHNYDGYYVSVHYDNLNNNK